MSVARRRQNGGMTKPDGALVKVAVNEELSDRNHASCMRVAMAAVVALLLLNFMDEHFNNARYTRAAVSMAERMIRSFG